jgi:hypothetical protein
MVSHGLYLRNIDGLRVKDLKIFYDCEGGNWDFIRIKIIPDHPFNLLSEMAIVKFLKTCRPDSFLPFGGLSNIIKWIVAISIAYFAILISRLREGYNEDFFEKSRLLFQGVKH